MTFTTNLAQQSAFEYCTIKNSTLLFIFTKSLKDLHIPKNVPTETPQN